MKNKVVIIGYGTMGKAMARALKRSGGASIFAVGRNTSENRAAAEIRKSDFTIIAVKPQSAKEAIERVKNHLDKNTVLVSIMAGVSLKKIAIMSGHKKIIRMMPNLGLSVGEGIAVWKSAGLNRAESARVGKFINKITDNFEVKNEDAINRATAVSGSGPAYFFLLADSMLAAAKSLGFSAEESRRLVGKTFKAAAALGEHGNYSELIKKVASKGGTTEAALRTFKQKGFEKMVSSAVRYAYQRAKQLSR
ncbi:MAG: Pyrroline-5-carboxylate reductase [Candidatus Nomurabacteria bacterium GW2011_GWA1_46_11]|uniref:Pyrroline-5-carboxylate reductase n=2 Tax=Candidatus Nomuraibacteriota TaxID=1752729 RepID=A0A0G1VYP4_9BACT|nr:MAG: Pyrroline-5-carboxylate reductase [Candidatus Nomurabacteria bacterium GW2011_GWA1_46_11]KKU75200.1 MAG: Pyrroline-5-carboxylate reductase [Candidatus Nomurabacteria bacterium GW2011_GWB1_47_6]